MNRARSVIEWEDTLRRLGLDVDNEPERKQTKELMAAEWRIEMDSTKRKRRKKMKKHK
jgi:hypothetical protein